MTHISKADFIKMLSTPMADERTELARRCFIFASLTSLSYIDVKKLYPRHISENSEGRKFIRKEREKTGVEFFVPLHPIAEKILRSTIPRTTASLFFHWVRRKTSILMCIPLEWCLA